MSIIAFIIFGIIVGFIARALMPGRQSMGIIGTCLLGIAGSFLGGVIGVSPGRPDRPCSILHSARIIGSVVGSAHLARRRIAALRAPGHELPDFLGTVTPTEKGHFSQTTTTVLE